MLALVFLLSAFLVPPVRAAADPIPTYAHLFDSLDEARYGRRPELKQGDAALSRQTQIPQARPFVARTSAKACSHKDEIRKKLGDNRNQGGLGWCSIAVGADFLTFYGGKRVSDLDLGLQFFRALPKWRNGSDGQPLTGDVPVQKLWAANIALAVEVGAGVRLCTEEEVSSADFMYAFFRKNAAAFDAKIFKTDEFVNTALLQLLQRPAGRDYDGLLGEGADTCWSVMTAQTLLPNLTSWEAIEIIRQAKSKEEAVHWLFTRGCRHDGAPNFPRDRKILEVLPPEHGGPHGGEFYPGIDAMLDSHEPVAIGFDAQHFLASAARRPGVPAPHAAMIVGREFRDGACHYLVRNSGGPSCAQFQPPFNSPRRCERGNVWISEKELNPWIRSVTVLVQ